MSRFIQSCTKDNNNCAVLATMSSDYPAPNSTDQVNLTASVLEKTEQDQVLELLYCSSTLPVRPEHSLLNTPHRLKHSAEFERRSSVNASPPDLAPLRRPPSPSSTSNISSSTSELNPEPDTTLQHPHPPPRRVSIVRVSPVVPSPSLATDDVTVHIPPTSSGINGGSTPHRVVASPVMRPNDNVSQTTPCTNKTATARMNTIPVGDSNVFTPVKDKGSNRNSDEIAEDKPMYRDRLGSDEGHTSSTVKVKRVVTDVANAVSPKSPRHKPSATGTSTKTPSKIAKEPTSSGNNNREVVKVINTNNGSSTGSSNSKNSSNTRHATGPSALDTSTLIQSYINDNIVTQCKKVTEESEVALVHAFELDDVLDGIENYLNSLPLLPIEEHIVKKFNLKRPTQHVNSLLSPPSHASSPFTSPPMINLDSSIASQSVHRANEENMVGSEPLPGIPNSPQSNDCGSEVMNAKSDIRSRITEDNSNKAGISVSAGAKEEVVYEKGHVVVDGPNQKMEEGCSNYNNSPNIDNEGNAMTNDVGKDGSVEQKETFETGLGKSSDNGAIVKPEVLNNKNNNSNNSSNSNNIQSTSHDKVITSPTGRRLSMVKLPQELLRHASPVQDEDNDHNDEDEDNYSHTNGPPISKNTKAIGLYDGTLALTVQTAAVKWEEKFNKENKMKKIQIMPNIANTREEDRSKRRNNVTMSINEGMSNSKGNVNHDRNGGHAVYDGTKIGDGHVVKGSVGLDTTGNVGKGKTDDSKNRGSGGISSTSSGRSGDHTETEYDDQLAMYHKMREEVLKMKMKSNKEMNTKDNYSNGIKGGTGKPVSGGHGSRNGAERVGSPEQEHDNASSDDEIFYDVEDDDSGEESDGNDGHNRDHGNAAQTLGDSHIGESRVPKDGELKADANVNTEHGLRQAKSTDHTSGKNSNVRLTPTKPKVTPAMSTKTALSLPSRPHTDAKVSPLKGRYLVKATQSANPLTSPSSQPASTAHPSSASTSSSSPLTSTPRPQAGSISIASPSQSPPPKFISTIRPKKIIPKQ